MKTKPTSIRFDQNDLLLAQNLSGIKKPQKLVDLLIAEYVKPLKGKTIDLPKDYMNIKEIGILKADGKTEKIPTASEEEIMGQIKQFQSEIMNVPKSFSETGRIIWVKERNKRIQELKNQLKV